jgi:hypothetical protein
MPDRYRCVECSKPVTATKNQRYRTHTNVEGEKCAMSSDEIPPVELEAGPIEDGADPGVPEEGRDYAVCRDCGRKVKLTRLGYYEPHDSTLRGGVRCELSGVRHRTEETVPVPEEILGPTDAPTRILGSDSQVAPFSGTAEELYAREEAWAEKALASRPLELEARASKPSSPEPTSTPEPSPSESDPEESSGPTGRPLSPGRPLQPGYVLPQPPDYVKAEKKEMSEKAKEIASRLKEIFYAYTNRNTADNRTAQTTLGPSEIGTPCDRRLAMSLMGVEPVNPGGDGWPAFVGTCTHDGLDKMFQWASARTGRFVTEMRLQLPSEYVPKGTADLLDRVFMVIIDHKIQGEYALRKMREEGPPDHYRVQAHTYALGAVLAGEKVKDVAIVSWPRAGSSLDQMYVWTEPFDRQLAEDAIRRVENIARETHRKRDEPRPPGLPQYTPLEVAKTFETGDDCRYCPFHQKTDKAMERGCPGQ